MSRFALTPRPPFGSLLKGAKPETAAPRKGGREKRPKPVKVPREQDGKHLAMVRRCPCLSCDTDPAGTAAHLRMTREGKTITGVGIKPDDRWTLPLCDACHLTGAEAQHKIGEPKFWGALGLDPFKIASDLRAVTGDIMAMRAVIFKARENRK